MFQIFALPLHALKTFGHFMFVPHTVTYQWWQLRGEAERFRY